MERILVVGAGPAGSACAWLLSRAGIPCVLADRSEFPRPKSCGGVLSGRASDLLTGTGMISEMELEDLTVQIHSSMTMNFDFRELRTFRNGNPPIRMVNRTRFDAFLRRRAVEEGAETLHDTFMGLSGTTALFLSGKKMEFERMVGADGAASRVRRSMPGGRFSRPCPALTTVVNMSETALLPFMEKGLQIFLFSGLLGYGWLFPRKGDAVAGVGSFGRSHEGLGDLMSRLLVHTGLGTSSPVTGALLPAGDQKILTGEGPFLLTGDAAGLCDRVSGEGISHAVESGFEAARAIVRNEETWGDGADCIDTVRKSRRYRHLLYGAPFMKLAVKALSRTDNWYGKYWGIVSGTSDYKDLFRTWTPSG